LGSVKAGTLRLTSTSDGLLAEVDLPNTTFGNDAWETVKRGDVTTMSFGFYPVNERTEIQNGKEMHYLTEVRLLEVSFAVAWPAYEDTTSMARAVRGIDLDKLESVLAKETIESNDLSVVKDTIEKLRALLEPSPSTTEAAQSTSAGDLIASLYDVSSKL
jgi:phage head maturation protease